MSIQDIAGSLSWGADLVEILNAPIEPLYFSDALFMSKFHVPPVKVSFLTVHATISFAPLVFL